jgi:hypothetical protein
MHVTCCRASGYLIIRGHLNRKLQFSTRAAKCFAQSAQEEKYQVFQKSASDADPISRRVTAKAQVRNLPVGNLS